MELPVKNGEGPRVWVVLASVRGFPYYVHSVCDSRFLASYNEKMVREEVDDVVVVSRLLLVTPEHLKA